MSTPATGVQEWRDIPWSKLARNVHQLQRRIYRASHRSEVSMTRIAPARSRMSAKVLRTVLKTSRAGDRPAEFDVLAKK